MLLKYNAYIAYGHTVPFLNAYVISQLITGNIDVGIWKGFKVGIKIHRPFCGTPSHFIWLAPSKEYNSSFIVLSLTRKWNAAWCLRASHSKEKVQWSQTTIASQDISVGRKSVACLLPLWCFQTEYLSSYLPPSSHKRTSETPHTYLCSTTTTSYVPWACRYGNDARSSHIPALPCPAPTPFPCFFKCFLISPQNPIPH